MLSPLNFFRSAENRVEVVEDHLNGFRRNGEKLDRVLQMAVHFLGDAPGTEARQVPEFFERGIGKQENERPELLFQRGLIGVAEELGVCPVLQRPATEEGPLDHGERADIPFQNDASDGGNPLGVAGGIGEMCIENMVKRGPPLRDSTAPILPRRSREWRCAGQTRERSLPFRTAATSPATDSPGSTSRFRSPLLKPVIAQGGVLPGARPANVPAKSHP